MERRAFMGMVHQCSAPLAAAGYLLHADRRALVRAAVWLGMSLMAGDILLGGHSDLYFSPSIAWTVAAAAIAALGLGLIQGIAAYQRVAHAHPHTAATATSAARVGRALAALFVLPVALGIFSPPVVLGAASIALREANVTMIPAPGTTPAPPGAPLHTDLLQLQALVQNTSQSGHSSLRGRLVDLVGFVYHRPDLPAGAFLLTRFITPHCVAEAQPLAILVHVAPSQATALKDDTWVQVQGRLAGTELNGRTIAELNATAVGPIQPPDDPYLIY